MFFSKTLSLLFVLVDLAIAGSSISAVDRAALTTFQATNFGTKLGSTCACTTLKAFFPGKVLSPGSSAYTGEATFYYDLRVDLSPKCIFVPVTANDVAQGVVVLEACQSQFAIRGRGHMPVSISPCSNRNVY